MWFKTLCTWVENAWNGFEAWVASWAPAFKTKIVAALGAIGSASVFLQGYVTNLPVTTFVTAEQIGIASFILFTLAYWLRGIGDRVDERAA